MSTDPGNSGAHSQQATVLVVDDDHEMVSALSDILRQAGYRTLGAHSGHEALALVERGLPDVLISDLRMAGMTGHGLQAELKRIAPDLPVIIITAFGSIQTAVESMKLGAFDYITKPFSNGELLLIVSRALENRDLRIEVKRLRIELARNHGLENIIAANPKMTALLSKLAQVADSNVSVLITGESGTGKDLLARALHFLSPRHDGPFVPVNCAAIPESLIESELFGHARGAFTDAKQSKLGLFVAASHGTLFLDEIGEMLPSVQAKLLRVIEDKRVRPLGATGETTVDVRVIAATNADLEKAVADGRFRSDLFYRIATVTMAVPPLRDRPEDIPLLIKHFLVRASAEAGKPPPELDADTTEFLTHYRWPGNIRELQNALQQAVLLCSGGKITRSDLPDRITGKHHSPARLEELASRRMPLQEVEREYARAVLASVNNHRGEAAAILGVDRKTLTRKLEDPD
ncbi:sigma-54-dependent transcriptional regulator [Candidatus Binatus sp.]|uniref:sigma-54-dependent transcriptional regulator n=1 Tax=Candidatus Binatus sp. TaxID=2811406 RepID=UPI003CC614F5